MTASTPIQPVFLHGLESGPHGGKSGRDLFPGQAAREASPPGHRGRRRRASGVRPEGDARAQRSLRSGESWQRMGRAGFRRERSDRENQHARKSMALAAALPDLIAPDCTGMMGVDERLAHIESELAGFERLLLIGSSFGGLMACLFASRHPGRVATMVLCAPALHDPLRAHVAKIERVPSRCVILHRTQDEIVPVQASRRFAERFGVELIELDDGHRLRGSRDVIVRWTLNYAAR